MFAFVDETGNTGANLLDPNQPEFFTGALITRTDFDKVRGSTIRRLCREHSISSIHASVVGLGPIESMAPELLRLFKSIDARFFFSRVEKRYLLATKVFDTFFDSGENPAVPWTAYNIRELRLMLCFRVAGLLDDHLAKEFWDMLMAKRESVAREMIPRICETFLERIHLLPDARTQSIVSEAFLWSRSHPEALDIFIPGRQAKQGHMPNLVAFTNLLAGLEHLSKKWGRRLRRLVHDRQGQFESTMEEWHRLFSNAKDVPITWLGDTYSLRRVYGSTFEVVPSDKSPGIQVADLVLWLLRKAMKGETLPPSTERLVRHVHSKAHINDFSFQGVGSALEAKIESVMESEIPASRLEEGQRIGVEVERRRLEAVALYELDGMMPYERQLTNRVEDGE